VTAAASLDSALRRLAIAAWLLTIAMTVAAIAIRVVSGAPPLPNRFSLGDAATIAIGILQVATTTVAALILVRVPRQLVGWLLMATGVFYAVSILAAVIAFAAYAVGPAGLLTAQWGGWFAFASSTVSGVTIVAIPFVFPDGRFTSPTVGRALFVFAAPALAVGMAMLLQPGRMLLVTFLDNPLGVGPDLFGALPPVVLGGIAAYIGAPVVIAAVSLTRRFRRSRGVERQQLKWFVASAIVMTTALIITGLFGFVLNDGVRDEWPLVAYALAATAVPIAIGIAILRYRLYAIDRIISRTISYGVLTALLVAVFAIVVVGLQTILSSFTRGDAVPVAVSTLVVFALFQPLRRKVQTTIDRRFYRTPYNVERIQAAFAARLSNNVDLESLAGEVRNVVGAAIAPESVGLWLRRNPTADR
jgi:hypothetical protein